MRKVCPNYGIPDGLETVLEVPIPEEMFVSNKTSHHHRPWQNMKSWMNMKQKPDTRQHSMVAVFGGRNTEIQLLLGVIGTPLIPLPIVPNHDNHSITKTINDHPIEASMAKYIVKQYIAAVGGEKALGAIVSGYGFLQGSQAICRNEI